MRGYTFAIYVYRTLPTTAFSGRSVRALSEANVIPFTIGVKGQIILQPNQFIFILPNQITNSRN